MLRSFNYTGRKRIPREDLTFEWVEGTPDQGASFNANLDFKSLENLRTDGRVWVEAYSGATVARFDFGEVGQVQEPPDRRLDVFPRGLKPHFRVKVVAPDDKLKTILAFADRISPAEKEELNQGKQSILPVEYVDLDDEVWRLRMDDSLDPVLQLNDAISEPVNIRTLAKRAGFIALVYPAVIRQILSRLLLEEDATTQMEHNWIKFGADLASESCPDPESYGDSEDDLENFKKDARDWIEQVVKGFCREKQARHIFTEELKENHKDD